MRPKRLSLLITMIMASLAGASVLSSVAFAATRTRNVTASHEACLQSFNPYRAARSFLRSCGDGVYPVRAVRKLSGGGAAYSYKVAGLTTVREVPPAGFSPLTASAAKLAEYGYPARPAGGRALRDWITLMRRARPSPAAPYLVTDKALEKLPRPHSATQPVNADNPIWAGNMAISHTYTNVYGYWLEPNIYSTQCTSPTIAESTWVGLGGWNSGILAQDGTAVGEGSSGVGAHEAWYEFINTATDTNVFVPIPLYATPGGEFYSIIDRVSGGYHVYVENLYAGGAQAYTVNFSPYDGSTAEMIVEDPYGGSSGSATSGHDLDNFKSFEVEDAEASDNSGSSYAGLASWPHDDDVMKSPNGDVTMAYAGAAFNSGDSWYDYQSRCY
jgi:Peptidase A4 family